MGLTYFKRFRMEIELTDRDLSWPPEPRGYRYLPWCRDLLGAHAEAKFQSFRDEIDANVFPCLGELAGCRRLMNDIAGKQGFVPGATWLVVRCGPDDGTFEECGTIQGVRDRAGMGAIQNVGIAREHRNRGLGTGLILRSLDGFRRAGIERVHLQVTAENVDAIRLYRRMGFKTVKTVYKAAEVACS
jgi:ribosomal protein S18 acetylase RimI-like enzyme